MSVSKPVFSLFIYIRRRIIKEELLPTLDSNRNNKNGGSMSFPGLGLAVIVGTAIAGIIYAIYQQSATRQQDYTYNDHHVPINQKLSAGYDRPRNVRRREANICTICMDDLSERIHTLMCSHSFHRKCIAQWFELGNKDCPICRSDAC